MCRENTLEALYYGNIIPSEKCFDRDSEYARFIKIVSENKEKLTSFLNGIPTAQEAQRLFSQLMGAQNELLEFSEQDRFIEGFMLGARFMLDTFLIPRESAIADIR